ncbi:MAG: hypothetical protein AAFX08_02365 [Pseudomonadota bacterium]
MRSILVLTLALAPAVAGAQTIGGDSGLYGRVSGGVSFTPDIDVSRTFDPERIFLNPPPSALEIETSQSWSAGAAVGYDFTGPFRAEVEYRYIRSGVDQVTPLDGFSPEIEGVPPPLPVDEGGFGVHAVLANAVLAPQARIGPFQPFVSAGAGAARIAERGGLTFGLLGDRADWSPAFQGRVGLSAPVSNSASVSLDYAYLRTLDLQFGADSFPDPSGVIFREDVDGLGISTISLSFEKRF